MWLSYASGTALFWPARSVKLSPSAGDAGFLSHLQYRASMQQPDAKLRLLQERIREGERKIKHIKYPAQRFVLGVLHTFISFERE